ncbi:unnamed protein product [Closterium sp. Yama58-4]|nr:unnamed protein product [Closterium sp. Yama58-4]
MSPSPAVFPVTFALQIEVSLEPLIAARQWEVRQIRHEPHVTSQSIPSPNNTGGSGSILPALPTESRSSPLFITNAWHRDHFAAEASTLRRVASSLFRRRLRSEGFGILPQVFAHEIPSSKGARYIHRTAFRTLARGGMEQAKGVNTTAPPRHPRHGANGTVAAGNRTKGGHPNKRHHRGNDTAAGGPKRGNGTAAGGPKRGNGTANGNAPKNGGGGAANKPRRPKKIAEETCSSKTSWPEVVGMTGEKARNYILSSMPECKWDVKVIPYGRPVTKDYRTDRVRVFIDREDIVRVAPSIG